MFRYTFLVLVLFGFSKNLLSSDIREMILLNTKSPFLLDIFEVSNKVALGAGAQIDSNLLEYHPAEVTASNAHNICKKLGKRLPFKSEWLMAATYFEGNQNYSTVTDSLEDDQRFPIVINNKRISPVAVMRASVDKVGTRGLSGNVPEWVIDDATGVIMMCGGGYFTSSESDIVLTNICSKHTIVKPNTDLESLKNPVSGFRCSLDVAVDVNNYNFLATEALLKSDGAYKTYLGSIDFGRIVDSSLPGFTKEVPKRASEVLTMQEMRERKEMQKRKENMKEKKSLDSLEIDDESKF